MFKNKLYGSVAYAPEGVGSGADQGKSGSGGTGDAGNAGKGNGGNNVDLLEDFWDTPNDTEDEERNGKSGSDGNGTGTPQNPNQVMQDFLNQLDFSNGVDGEELQKAIENRDHKSVMKLLNQQGKNIYRRAVGDIYKVMQTRIDAAVEQAVQRAGVQNDVSSTIRDMQAELPFTKEKTFAPIAQGILQQALRKGKSSADAIKVVGAFFDRTIEAAGKQFGYSKPKDGGKPNRRINQLPGGNQGDDDGEQKAPDWGNFLGLVDDK